MPTDKEITLAHLPPQEIEAEQHVLGACLLEPQHTLGAAYVLADDFYKTAHRKIFDAMRQVMASGQEVDVITVAAFLRGAAELEPMGGPATYLSYLINITPTAANFRSHERLVISAAQRRVLIRACREAEYRAYDEKDADRIVSDAITALAGARRHDGGAIITHREIILRGYEAIERRSALTSVVSGIPTGFRDLDIFLDGLQPQYYLIAGRPSMGKTALAEGIARNAARSGHRVGFISIEMGEHQIALRALSRGSGVPLSRLLRGKLRDDDWDRFTAAAGAEVELQIDYAFSAFSERAVERAIDDMVQRLGCKLIIVDYLQLMAPDDRDGNREQEVARQSRMFKRKVKEHNVPHVILSQLNRALEARPDKRPMLADLRESGAIEQDADVIIFVYRDEVYHCKCSRDGACACGKRGKAELLIRKGRMEGTGNVDLLWEAPTTSFRNTEG